MNIYGVALLAFCFISGQLTGEYLGALLGINANIGGVGFAMLLLILLNSWLSKYQVLNTKSEAGIHWWSNMYIPIIVAMASIQNVKLAVSSGFLAICAGIIPTIIGFLCIPFLSKLFVKKTEENNGNNL